MKTGSPDALVVKPAEPLHLALTLSIQKNSYYFVRTIPVELREHFGG
jgi:hypothetical protein